MPVRAKSFSLEETKALIPQLEKILTRLLQKKESHEKLHDEFFMYELLHEATKHAHSESHPLDSRAHHVDGQVLDLEEDLKEIRSLGCILRNLERGWVEFLGERQGQAIYWCWKKGENHVQFYRPVDGLAMERYPL